MAKIDDLVEQNKTLLTRIDELLARIAELEGRAAKMPTNSSLPPSSGQRANVANATTKKGRKGHPGVTRELCASPDVTRDVHVELCAGGAKLPAAEQVLARAYDHAQLPPIKPVTTRINLHRADCPCCGKTTATADSLLGHGARHIETGELSYALAGNSPNVVINADGQVHITGTAFPIEHCLKKFRSD